MNNMDKLLKKLEEKEFEENELERRLATVRIELRVLRDVAGKNKDEPADVPIVSASIKGKTLAQRYLDTPDISLRDAASKGICELREFTKKDLQNWLEKAYPKLGTKVKSLDRVIYQLIEEKKVVLFIKNFGARRPAIYKLVNGEM